MAVLTRQDLRNQLQRREIGPVYVLFGAETYLRDVAAKTISNYAFAPEDLRDFNETTFSLNVDGNLRGALAVAQQLPMMSRRRVVRIADVRISATGFRDTLTEEDEPLLRSFLNDPPPSTTVVFVADELNGVRKLSKLLKENATAVDFEPLKDNELLKWAKERFDDAGATIDGASLNRLIARVGPDVRRLTNEVNKLSTAALPENRVTAELIESLVPNTREISNFALTDYLIAGRKKDAIAAARKLLDDGAEPLAMLGSMAYTYRRLLIAREMIDRGVERREIASAVKLRYSDQDTFLSAARRADKNKLSSAIGSLAQTDLDIKTSKGGTGPGAARARLEMLVCELALN